MASSSPSLAFLAGYYRYMKSLSAGLSAACGAELVLLLKSPDAPESFKPMLIEHLLTLLNESDTVSLVIWRRSVQVRLPVGVLNDLLNWAMKYAAEVERRNDEAEKLQLRTVRFLLIRCHADATLIKN